MIPQNRPSGDTPISVLIVDDSEMIRLYLQVVLHEKYALRMACDGEEALELYHRQRPEVCLLDMNMPRKGGLDVIRHIRKFEQDNDLFILVLTADNSNEQMTLALNEGANDYLVKPIDAAELVARIGVAERQVRLTRDLRRAYAAISNEIDQIAQLQRRLLPTTSPLIPGLSVQSLYLPSAQASGDYFDYFTLPDGGLRVIMADVSGHGARAAFIMSMVRTMVRFRDCQGRDLSGLISLMNNQLRFFVGDEGDFVTLFAADIHPEAGVLEFINAGHTPAVLLQDEALPQRLAATMPALGVMPVDYQAQSLALGSSNVLFLFTDGCFEWQDQSGKMHDLDAFWEQCAVLVGQPDFSMSRLFPSLGWPQTPPLRDDASALWVRLRREEKMHTTADKGEGV